MKTILYWFIGVMLLVVAGELHAQDAPLEVKQAIAASVKASDSPNATDKVGRFHEEGGIWGLTANGKVIVIPAKAGPTNAKCGDGASIDIGDAADPSLSAYLVTVLGEWHVHPSGVQQGKNGGTCHFIQSPSHVDIANTMGNPCNIVVGAADSVVYFYDSTGVTKKVKLKEFLKEKP
jgi:hypothetical protein